MNARCLSAPSLALLFWTGPACAQEAIPSQPPASEPPVILPGVVVEAARPANALRDKIQDMDRSRDDFLLPKLGATSYSMDREAIESLAQGNNTPLYKALLQ